MKEPILSAEEIASLAEDAKTKWNSQADRHNQWVELDSDEHYVLVARELESAILEKLCGEPVAWRAPNLSGLGDAWAYRDADDRFEDQHGEPVGEPLYVLNRSKS